MKKHKQKIAIISVGIIGIILLFSSANLSAQNVAVTDDETYTAEPTAMLDVKSDSKGLLIPRLTTTQRNGISNPAHGLLVYDSDEKVFYYFDGSSWVNLSLGQAWEINSNYVYLSSDNGRVGIGTSTPNSKLEVKADNTFTENDTLFAVKDQNGNIVFAVFPDGAKVYVNSGTKGKIGGFAVSGRTSTKAEETEYLRVTADSTRIYVNEDATKGKIGGFAVSGRTSTKGLVNDYLLVGSDSTRIYVKEDATKGKIGGFAVSGRTSTKGLVNDYLLVGSDSTRIYVNEDAAKGKIGGFAVSGRTSTKGTYNDYLQVTKDSTRVYISESGSKGKIGGFAVSGRTSTKGLLNDYFNISGNQTVETIDSEARIFWYPKKEAFLSGRVLVEGPDSVGTNSMATGFESKAKGNYSQALGYKAIARGDYSTAIGKNAVAESESSFAFGEEVIASGKNSFAFGSFGRDEAGTPTNVNTEASGDYSVAFGLGSLALNTGSYAFGASDTSSGKWSFAIGGKSHASGDYSIAMGYKSKAYASLATAIGNGALATGNFSNAIGGFAKSEGIYAVAIGNSSALNDYSVAIGYLAKSKSLNSLAFGNNTSATAPYSMALGNNTLASGSYSTALTTNSKASGLASAAMGHLSEARGNYALAMGYMVEAPGNYSSATGMGTISQQLGSSVTGRYNIAKGDSLNYNTSYPVFIVGNGTDELTRSNALEIYPDGTSKFWGETMILGDGSITSHQPELTLSEAGFGFPSSYWKEWTFKGEGKRMNIYETNSSSSNVRMTFADGGNIGIGTTSPGEKLHVNGNLQINNYLYGSYGTIAASRDEWLRLNDGGSHDNGIYIGTDLRVDGEFRQGSADYGGYEIQTSGQMYTNDYLVAMGGVHVGGTSDPGTNNLVVDGHTTISGSTTVNGLLYLTRSAPIIVFSETEAGYTKKWYMGLDGKALFIRENSTSSSNERFVMEEGGNIGLGVADPRVKLDLVGSIYYTGSCTDVSDIKLKTNIRTVENVLLKLKQLNGVYYHFKDTAKYGAAEQIGMIAQDMQKVFPQLVNEMEEGVLGINYIDFSAVLLQAIKEQQQIIENQNSEQEDFKIELMSLKQENAELKEKLNEIIELLSKD